MNTGARFSDFSSQIQDDLLLIEGVFESVPSHPVGIDLELLVRRDILGLFSTEVEKIGWVCDSDPSVKSTQFSHEEIFYAPIEISTENPRPVSSVLRDLSYIFSWLKHEDHVGYNRESGDIVSGLASSHFRDSTKSKKVLRKFGYDLYILTRGKSPMNLSAGCHLHFDIRSWFSSPDHIERFIRLFYASSDQIKGQIIPGRYSLPYERADLYATFNHTLGGHSPAAPLKSKDTRNDPRYRAQQMLGLEKRQAMNAWLAYMRGDIEIRVFHSSLNIQTVTHWFSLIIDMITKTAGSAATWNDIDPAIRKESDKRTQSMKKSNFQGHVPNWYSPAVTRILGLGSEYPR